MNHGRQSEAARRYGERKKREDEAPRLKDEVPNLTSLKFDVEERREGSTTPEVSHIRRVVVENAPALFVFLCGDPHCEGGGHDVTYPILRALEDGQTRFDGEDACSGTVGTASCRRILRYVGTAAYADGNGPAGGTPTR